VVARAVVRDRFGHGETARVLSQMMLVMGVAPILAPLLGGFVLHAAGWRAIFWLLAVFGVGLAALAFLRLPETRSDVTAAQARSENPLKAYGSLMLKPRLVGYAMAGALNGATLFTYISSSPDLLINHYKIPAAHFGWVFSINAIGLVAGGQLNRRLLRRRSPDQVLKVSTLVACGIALTLAIIVFSGFDQRWAVLLMLFGLLSTYGLLQGNTLAGALSVDPARAGSTSALLGAASFATGAVASWLTGLFQHDGSPRAMAVTLVVATAGSALALRTLALPRRAETSSPS
jgi:DHA1 family bicyclomycin/chloramphenicol resistance-like MFS transporter